MTQEEFNRMFEKLIEHKRVSWKLLKYIIEEYQEEFINYAERHKKKLVIREVTKCDGCKWNDGHPNSACYNCD